MDKAGSLKATSKGLGALFLWAMSALVISELENIPTFQLSGTVFIIAFLYTCFQLTWKRRWTRISPSTAVLTVGFIALLGNQAAYVYSIKSIPPEHAEIVYYLWPILAVLISALFLEKSTVDGMLSKCAPFFSALLGFGGIYLLCLEGRELGEFSMERIEGYLFAFLAAAAMVLYSLFSRYNVHIPLEMNGIWCGMAALPCFAINFYSERLVMPTPYEWLLMAFIGIAILSYSLNLWSIGMRHGHFNTLSVVSYITPLLSVLILMAAGKAAFRSQILFACQLVILGGVFCALVDWAKQKI